MKRTAFRRAAALALAAGLALAPLFAPAAAYAADDGAVESAEESSATEAAGQVTMCRLYNKWSGEHLYTSSSAEIKKLVSLGWKNEGTAWVAPASSKTPVYRLYNPYSGDHHYTTDAEEYAACAKSGWRKEGVAWYSDDNKGTALLRGYNPYVSVGTHHYTTDPSEMSTMKSNGWRAEGVAWYGLRWVEDKAAWDEKVWVDNVVDEDQYGVECDKCGKVFWNDESGTGVKKWSAHIDSDHHCGWCMECGEEIAYGPDELPSSLNRCPVFAKNCEEHIKSKHGGEQVFFSAGSYSVRTKQGQSVSSGHWETVHHEATGHWE